MELTHLPQRHADTERRLLGKSILVTGAGAGIGRAIATDLAQQGAHVTIVDSNESAGLSCAEELRLYGADPIFSHADVTSQDAAQEVIDNVVKRFGRIDGLVNNAGITGPNRFDAITLEDWDRVLAINLTAPFKFASLVAPLMKAQGWGRIVNIGSIAATRMSLLGGAAYTASKSGLIGMTRHLAVELARNGITVNAVLPGITDTSLVVDAMDEAQSQRIADTVPMGRRGKPEDVGSTVSFLMSEEAAYISGISLEVDGALSVLPGSYTEFWAAKEQVEVNQ